MTSSTAQDNGYEIDVNQPRVSALLDLWANKPGFFYYAYTVVNFGKEYLDDNEPDPRIVLDDIKIAAYISGVDGLSKTERDLLIKNNYIWNGYHVSIEQLEKAVNDGLKMSSSEANDCVKEIARLYGPYVPNNAFLFQALTIAGSDGQFSSSEEAVWKEIAATMNVDGNTVDEIIDTYLLEVDFGNKLSALLSNNDNPRKEQQSSPYAYDYYNNYPSSSFFEQVDFRNDFIPLIALLVLFVSICVGLYNHFRIKTIAGFRRKIKTAKFTKLAMINDNQDTDF